VDGVPQLRAEVKRMGGKGGVLKEQEAGPVHQLIGNCGEWQKGI